MSAQSVGNASMNWILVNKLKSSNIETCLQAGKKIASQSTDAALRDARKILESRSADTRTGAIFIALSLPTVHARRIISTLLQDKNSQVRIETLRILRTQNQVEYSAEAASCLNDPEDEVILEAIETVTSLQSEGSGSYLAPLLTHTSKNIRHQTFIAARDFWKYEHLDQLKACMKMADLTISEQINETIRSIEERTKLLSLAIEKGGNGKTGVVAQPRFKSSANKGYNQQPVIIQQVQSPSNPYDLMDDNSDLEDMDGFTGVIKEVTVQDLIQLACVNRKSQAFKIKTREGTGEIYVKDGEIVHATFSNGDIGQDALFSILSFSKGQFKEMRYSDPKEQTITSPWEFLLMEAARIQDESSGSPEDLESM